MQEELVQTEQPEISTPEGSTDSDIISEPAQAPEEWAPDYKFKVMDKEYEFDEFIRPTITKDNYDKIKDLYTKAYGLDHEKSRAERYKSEFERLTPIEQQFAQQNKTLGYMGTLLQNKDYNTLFKELNIPDDAVAQYAIQRLNYRELPPEQQREQDRIFEERQRLRMLELQNQEYSQQLQSTVIQARGQELESYLQGPAKSAAESFDQRVGKPGAFREEVIRRGQMAYYTQKKDIPVAEAVNEVIRLAGISPQTQGQASNMNTANFHTPQDKKPYLPNIRGSNMSPVRKQFSSVDDLKKKYNEMFGD
jgi:hypothetical protein